MVSKVVLAADLNDLGHDYLPDQPEHRRITARMALTHRTGLANWRMGYDDLGGPLPLLFAPGSEYSYSGEGILFLQRAMEAISGKPIERLSAVVFLFDRMGTFVTSSRANVDFLKIGAGDESPFVVSLEAPASVARYRVSFRTDDGIVPHIDRRGASVAPEGTVGIQQSAVKSSVVSQQ